MSALQAASTDKLTILRAEGGALMAKRIRPTGEVVGYDRATWFKPIEFRVCGIDGLHAALRILLRNPYAAIVRGALIERPAGRLIRRLIHAKDGYAATLRPCARPWVALDFDSIPRPADVNAADLQACAAVAVGLLPPEFQGVRCAFQATAQHGIAPGIRGRAWFWLSGATTDAEVTRWLWHAPVDRSLFTPTQPHYTAAPVFEGGRPDHLPERLIMLPGRDAVIVPSPDQLAPKPAPSPATGDVRPVARASSAYVRAALVNGFLRITKATARHNAIVSECASLARFVVQGDLGEEQFRAVIHAAAAESGKTDAGEIDQAIAWGLERARAECVGVTP